MTAPWPNVWAGLSIDEAAGVVNFLHNHTDLNLTAAADAGSWDNVITNLDLAAPNKTVRLPLSAGTRTFTDAEKEQPYPLHRK